MKIQHAMGMIVGILLAFTLAACGGGGGGSSSGGGGGGGGGAPLTITTASLPNGTVGVVYSVTLQATGGTPPYTWSVSQGSLPSWATLNASTGAITGTPNAPGNATLTFRVTDSNNVTTQTNSLTLFIAPATPPPLTITTSSLPNGVVGTAYGATLQASGGTPPYTWSISSGSLPAWASLNASTGAITGTPNASGTTSFTVQVTDSAMASLTQNLSITVNTSNANLGLLSGQYAFVVSGYDSALAGSIAVDGKGNITAGTEDIAAPATTLSGSDLSITSGTYTVGSDHRGTLTYTDSSGNKFTFAFALGAISGGVAAQGQMIEFDSNPLEMSGQLALQSASAFSTTA
ncbi:MAG: putative Ig domain-containing protein, partial [Gammaproteobacteria bacterium]|nr:putative Ig domain-containing protein [Gammaproteobacteria bacterium]